MLTSSLVPVLLSLQQVNISHSSSFEQHVPQLISHLSLSSFSVWPRHSSHLWRRVPLLGGSSRRYGVWGGSRGWQVAIFSRAQIRQFLVLTQKFIIFFSGCTLPSQTSRKSLCRLLRRWENFWDKNEFLVQVAEEAYQQNTASTYPEPEDKEAFIRTHLYDYNYDKVVLYVDSICWSDEVYQF